MADHRFCPTCGTILFIDDYDYCSECRMAVAHHTIEELRDYLDASFAHWIFDKGTHSLLYAQIIQTIRIWTFGKSCELTGEIWGEYWAC